METCLPLAKLRKRELSLDNFYYVKNKQFHYIKKESKQVLKKVFKSCGISGAEKGLKQVVDIQYTHVVLFKHRSRLLYLGVDCADV